MSKTIVGKILAAILSVFKANWKSFAIKTADKVPNEVKEKLNIVIRVVNLFKQFVDSPTADIITAIIPGDVDDKIKEWLRERLKDYKLEEYQADSEGHLHLLASYLTQDMIEIPFGQAAFTIEAAYQKFKEDNK